MAGNGQTEWKMPKVEMGQIVLWKSVASDRAPTTAVVTLVGTLTINVHTIASGIRDFGIKTGVRHMDDPFLKRSQITEGVWSLTPRDEKINEMLAAFEYKKEARAERQPTSLRPVTIAEEVNTRG